MTIILISLFVLSAVMLFVGGSLLVQLSSSRPRARRRTLA